MILILTPPFMKPNIPHLPPLSLKGGLKESGIESKYIDLSIRVILDILSKDSLSKLFDMIEVSKLDEDQYILYSRRDLYIEKVDTVIDFLQKKNDNLAYKINNREFLPESINFDMLDVLDNDFIDLLDISESGKYLATLFVKDILSFLSSTIIPNLRVDVFENSFIKEKFSLDKILKELESNNPLSNFIEASLEKIDFTDFRVVSIMVDSPRNLFSALFISRWIKNNVKDIKIVFYSDFLNNITDGLDRRKVFGFTDYIVSDLKKDPLISIYKDSLGKDNSLTNVTFMESGEIVESVLKDLDIYPIDYTGIDCREYISFFDRLEFPSKFLYENDWNRVIISNGLYQKDFIFNDFSTDFNSNQSFNLERVISNIKDSIRVTGSRSFYFMDKTLSPSIIKKVALELVRENIDITWVGNVSIDRDFTEDLAFLSSKSGCIGVNLDFGVISERVISLVYKNYRIDDIPIVCNNFTSSGILVRGSLTYGFPTQSQQELIDSLELLRQLYSLGIIHSSFWQKFRLTEDSVVYKNPEKFGIVISEKRSNQSSIDYRERRPYNLERYYSGLKESSYSFINNLGVENSVDSWFDFKTPKTDLNRRFIERILKKSKVKYKDSDTVLWLGSSIYIEEASSDEYKSFRTYSNRIYFEYELPTKLALWINSFKNGTESGNLITFGGAKSTFPKDIGTTFSDFIRSDIWIELNLAGLKIVTN
ncbi:MAG: hypothetical protein CR982_03705 [Candidatus Cloacimonadota bacterium]|nr:MAG: hypothetical protein CR982_03705 [Candidatus Cloacimonadota bacterium]PIE79357.1 MAG: hypothetical protein CSA15_03355 [Candidatus Delongbacteria bacterium]